MSPCHCEGEKDTPKTRCLGLLRGLHQALHPPCTSSQHPQVFRESYREGETIFLPPLCAHKDEQSAGGRVASFWGSAPDSDFGEPLGRARHPSRAVGVAEAEYSRALPVGEALTLTAAASSFRAAWARRRPAGQLRPGRAAPSAPPRCQQRLCRPRGQPGCWRSLPSPAEPGVGAGGWHRASAASAGGCKRSSGPPRLLGEGSSQNAARSPPPRAPGALGHPRWPQPGQGTALPLFLFVWVSHACFLEVLQPGTPLFPLPHLLKSLLVPCCSSMTSPGTCACSRCWRSWTCSATASGTARPCRDPHEPQTDLGVPTLALFPLHLRSQAAAPGWDAVRVPAWAEQEGGLKPPQLWG